MRNTKSKRQQKKIRESVKIYFGVVIIGFVYYQYSTNRLFQVSHQLLLSDFVITIMTAVVVLLLLKNIRIAIRRKRYLVSGIKEIDKMDGVTFEAVCASHLTRLGYRVEETPASCDKGADLIAKKGRDTIAVQCKRYNNKLSNTCVQEVVASMKVYKANKCMVITNSYFTPNCRQVAEANDCILWDRDTIIRKFKLN